MKRKKPITYEALGLGRTVLGKGSLEGQEEVVIFSVVVTR